jgi:hypothetical protein
MQTAATDVLAGTARPADRRQRGRLAIFTRETRGARRSGLEHARVNSSRSFVPSNQSLQPTGTKTVPAAELRLLGGVGTTGAAWLRGIRLLRRAGETEKKGLGGGNEVVIVEPRV